MAQESYYGQRLSIGDPSDEPYEVTPGPDPLEHGKPNYLFVGVAGDVEMSFANGETIEVPLAAGYHLFRPTRILSATAEKIVAFYDGTIEPA